MHKITGITLLAFFITLSAHAQKEEVFAPGGKAIKGYDAVAFFTDAKPVMGADSLAFSWKDVNWLFATKEHLESFKANPEKFAPQYGGFCAFGSSQAHKSPTEAGTWTILNDKLYFNYNQRVKEVWTKNQDSLIKKADMLWPDLKNKP